MSLVDQYGRKIQNTAARAAQHDGYRPWEPVDRKDIDDLIPIRDRETLRSHANRVYINFGPIKGAINQRGMYAVGRAWNAFFRGMDKDFGDKATEWLNESFYSIGDVRGGIHDLKTNLFVWSKSIDVDGEVFILLTETDNKYPQYQGIPSHRICTPQGMADGPMRGGKLMDGIIYYPSGAPKEYAFVDKDKKLIEWIPAQNMIHLLDPEWAAQGRGYTALTHCINDCRDMIQSNEWERLAMLQMSAISLIEYNEHGGPDPDNPYNDLVGGLGDTGGKGMTVQSMDGGTVRYFRSNSGGKIEALQNTRPGSPFLDYHERLIKSAYVGLNWPYSFFTGNGIGGGTAQRTEIAAAQRVVDDRQDLLEYAMRRITGYAISKAIKRKELPASPEWYRFGFSKPPKLTIDDGRVMKELESSYKLGFKSASDITGAMGREYKDVIRQKAEEAALRQVIAKEIGDKYGVEIEPRELLMLTPNEMGEKQEKESNGKQPTTENDDDES
jgi:hypothetical protein